MELIEHNPNARPFLKWAGGKRALLPEILPRIPNFEGRFIEPFVGAGAVLLALPDSIPKIANDFNAELINVYKVIRDSTDELITELKKHKCNSEHFYKVRSWDREQDYFERSNAQRAARFIFLNKTCFNGLYRVNSKGQFNVPFGKQTNPEIFNKEHLSRVSQILNGNNEDGKKVAPAVKFRQGSFEKTTRLAKPGDFVYFDPPYDPLTSTSAFVSYHKEGFGREDQIQLRDEIVRLTELGIPILLSNSDTAFIRKIYRESKLFKIESIQVRRAIGAASTSRGMVPEVLVSNFESI